MDWIITTAVFLSVVKAALCFNINPEAWQTFSSSAAGFGYQVVQRQSDLLVSAPLQQYLPDKRGQIFRCRRNVCNPLAVTTQELPVNMSLGLTMTSDPVAQNTLACGPTIPKDCQSITMYNGACFQIDRFSLFGNPVPSSAKECQFQADIAFLLDGSGSVRAAEFQRMKTFVKNLVQSFLNRDIQFAVAQFSWDTRIHFHFNEFFKGTWAQKVDDIQQLSGGTNTATAIETVVNKVFTPTRGSRADVNKVLIVITDGESQESNKLPYAATLAEAQKIVRFAIGVGAAFIRPSALRELYTIASSPKDEHVFQVNNFDALEKILQSLQSKIFSIEGSQTSGESLKMEMAQEGFSAAYVPGGFQMAIVGANQWKGGFLTYTARGTEESTFEPGEIEPDSYLGYSMAVATVPRGQLTIAGAPRYRHMGAVFVVYLQRIRKRIEPSELQFQSGEYFGAEVCAMNVDGDRFTDLILISAPMYKETDREGRVYLCTLIDLDVDCHLDSPSVLRGQASDLGRFGSSLAVLPDLNNDGFSDLAVGAPLENNGQGSIYIFHGEGRGRINTQYSQRIAAYDVQTGLKFFGISISQTSYDQNGDSLPDLAVGSQGKVVLLRSRPIVMVQASVRFTPPQIPTQNTDGSKPLSHTAQICFTMTGLSPVDTAEAKINFTFTLDATRKVPNNRAYITDKQRDMDGMIKATLNSVTCFRSLTFFIVDSPEDALNELKNELRFTFDGVASTRTNLKPILAQQARTTTIHPLGFEINCGIDNTCEDDLKVDFNFTSSSVVKVGIDDLLDVTVSLENRNENSYNSRVILTYPPGLSFRKFTALTGRIECNSLDSEDSLTRGKTDCTVDKPIFKSKTKAFFIVSYGIDTNSQLSRRISITANATSGNLQHSPKNELYKMQEIDVKYSIFVTFESSLSYSNFSFGDNDLQKPVQQLVKVTNNIRLLNFTVVIRVPVKLGSKDIWADLKSLMIPDCQEDKDEEPVVTDFVAQIKKNKSVDCSVARCRVFKCNSVMGRLDQKQYKISANLSSGWIEQIGLHAAKFLLTSTISMEYDKNQYIFFSTGSNNNPPVRKIETEVEVYPKPDFTKEIVGGSLGGLAILALLTAGLYKAGFFKSKYKAMIDEAGEGAGPGADGGASAAELGT
ncbi:hypothetical protein Q5P01_023283 [Channa striata]|uniref:VWFA domain-containing protein n=1 Tax=Channa striata TaxID=64152 RepID=A0AA88LK36_CHASR|nr:hypothetical protein Q5P01_023283 [Channa striata]